MDSPHSKEVQWMGWAKIDAEQLVIWYLAAAVAYDTTCPNHGGGYWGQHPPQLDAGYMEVGPMHYS
jgi:hypothetical protein